MESYVNAWRRLTGSVPQGVSFDQGTPLRPLLEEANVGVMAFSTTVLDCAAYDIPVLGLGWCHFFLKESLAKDIDFCDSINSIIEHSLLVSPETLYS
jgi:hypothetical protein